MLLLRTSRKAGWNTRNNCCRASKICWGRHNFMGRHDEKRGTCESWANVLNCYFPLCGILWGWESAGSWNWPRGPLLRKRENSRANNNFKKPGRWKWELVYNWEYCQDLRMHDSRKKGGNEKWAWNTIFLQSIFWIHKQHKIKVQKGAKK